MNIYVGNLPQNFEENELKALFEQHGTVSAIRIIRDRATNVLRGFGFIDMPQNEQAQEAIKKLDGFDFKGSKLRVNEAKERTDRRPRRPGGGRGGYNSGGRRGYNR
jgi:RNA recognition motif-containing protein